MENTFLPASDVLDILNHYGVDNPDAVPLEPHIVREFIGNDSVHNAELLRLVDDEYTVPCDIPASDLATRLNQHVPAAGNGIITRINLFCHDCIMTMDLILVGDLVLARIVPPAPTAPASPSGVMDTQGEEESTDLDEEEEMSDLMY